MAQLVKSNSKIPRLLYIILLSAAGAIFALLIIGTVFALVRPKNSKALVTLGNTGENERKNSAPSSQNNDIRVFSGLMRLRIPLANSSTLILSIAFPYPASDTAFTEELAVKIGDFRSITTGYFSSLPPETAQINEEAAKKEILSRFNAILRLGRIETLYFNDLMVIDGSL